MREKLGMLLCGGIMVLGVLVAIQVLGLTPAPAPASRGGYILADVAVAD